MRQSACLGPRMSWWLNSGFLLLCRHWLLVLLLLDQNVSALYMPGRRQASSMVVQVVGLTHGVSKLPNSETELRMEVHPQVWLHLTMPWSMHCVQVGTGGCYTHTHAHTATRTHTDITKMLTSHHATEPQSIHYV